MTNAEVFDQPIYNYTREFPCLWEELRIPIAYEADRAEAERILLDVTARHSQSTAELGALAQEEIERRYRVQLLAASRRG